IDDTIEGWSNSLEVLVSSYCRGNPWTGRKIVFDFSKIRKKGSILKTSGGRAPGYRPLKTALTQIKKLLDHLVEVDHVEQLRAIHIYDIMMYFMDCVLSGGVRRTASIVIFDEDDYEMM